MSAQYCRLTACRPAVGVLSFAHQLPARANNMSNVLDKKVFSATEFLQAWGLWQSKGHDPASKLYSFSVEGGRINVGLLDYSDLETVVFPAHAHADYAAAVSYTHLRAHETKANLVR